MDQVILTRDENESKDAFHNRLFRQLQKEVSEAGLLEQRDRNYYIQCSIYLGGVLASIWICLSIESVKGAALAAILFGIVVSGWAGVLGHDAGHGQAPQSSKKARRAFQLILGNVMLGFSSSWWVDKHTAHHANPNLMGKDRDLDLPLPLSAEIAREKGLDAESFRVKNGWWIFWLLLPLQAANARLSSIRYVAKAKPARQETILQYSTIALYFLLYGALVLAITIKAGPMAGFVFVSIGQATHGVYNSLIFATNHKGMPVHLRTSLATWLELQILTSRNVKSGSGALEAITTWMYGGLNYQIEHHLFPKMPRCNLKHARPIVMAFCQRYGFEYYETSIPRSYYEVGHTFKVVARDLIESPMGA